MKKSRLGIVFLAGLLMIGGLIYTWDRNHLNANATPLVSGDTFHAAQGRLGDTLTLLGFKEKFNQIADRKIGTIQTLKDDHVHTSFLYAFDSEYALSGIVDNSTGLLDEIIFIGPDLDEFTNLSQQIMEAVDPGLSTADREEILQQLEPGKDSEKGAYVVKHDILYRTKINGPYLQFTAEKDE